MKTSLPFLLFLLFFPLSGLSNAKVAGNGGDVVVCRNGSGAISSVEMFDYFEARVLRGIQIELPDGSTPEQIAAMALAGLWERDPVRAQRYLNFIGSFDVNKTTVNEMLTDVPDSNHLVVPNKECRIEQLVIRQEVRFPEDRLFLVSGPLWDYMSDAQRAGAILHEAFYEEALENGAEYSSTARYFHSKLVSKSFYQMSDREYLDMMLAVSEDFPLLYLYGMQLLPRTVMRKPLSWFSLIERDRFTFTDKGELAGVVNDPARKIWVADVAYSVTGKTLVSFLADSDCVAADVRFTDDLGGKLIEWKQLSNGKSSKGVDGSCQNVSLHGQLVDLRAGSNLLLHPRYVRVSLEEDSCYHDGADSYCGEEITIDYNGRIIQRQGG